MKMDKEEFNKRRKKAPKGTYVLMTLMGAYMFYIISRIVDGLAEPDVSGKLLIYIAIILIGGCGIFFVGFGIRALVKGEFAEMQPDEEEEIPVEEVSVEEKTSMEEIPAEEEPEKKEE